MMLHGVRADGEAEDVEKDKGGCDTLFNKLDLLTEQGLVEFSFVSKEETRKLRN